MAALEGIQFDEYEKIDEVRKHHGSLIRKYIETVDAEGIRNIFSRNPFNESIYAEIIKVGENHSKKKTYTF